ncbi:MAG TPA: enoyl-CoA hydratase/isomerase family protein [Mycobacteriales bacterium]|jgi:enoyl-CoA hydratase/carnithine racemase|nr:enoyl-CoA hydratase/isomerase family protein [Mycobacteriales bacterium]
MTLVERSDAAGVTTLTLNRPEKLNAINLDMLAALRGHVDALANDPSIGCVVLTGAGRCFSAGHDLADTGQELQGAERFFAPETVDRLERLPQPTIAKVHGYCLTGALELALGCDLVVAAEGSRLADTHGRWGLVPTWGMSVRLPERVGVARAKELSYTGRHVSAAEAAAIGLVEYCVSDDELEARTDELARMIVANSWGTNRMTKALHAARTTMTRQAALDFERTRPYGLPADRDERAARR